MVLDAKLYCAHMRDDATPTVHSVRMTDESGRISLDRCSGAALRRVITNLAGAMPTTRIDRLSNALDAAVDSILA